MNRKVNGWEYLSLSEACIFQPKKSEVKDLGDVQVSFVPMAIVNEKDPNFFPEETKPLKEVYKGYTYFKNHDVLLAKVTPCFENGKSGIARNLENGIGFGSSEYYVLRPAEKLIPEWIYYLVSSDKFLREGKGNMSGAVGLKRVTKDFVSNYIIPLPPLPVQKQIVAKLDALFERIDKSIALLEENIKHTQDLMASVLDEIYLKHKEKLVAVEDVCEKITDGTHATPKYTKEGVPFLSVKDISKGFIDLSDTKFISREEHEVLYKRCNPERNDILYTKVGTTGIAKVVDIDDEFSLFVSVALLKPKNIILPNYFELILNSPKAYEQAQRRTRGVANRNLVLKDIKQIEIPIPTKAEQTTIVKKFSIYKSKHDLLISQQNLKLQNLKSLKSSLLDMAFKGELIE